VDKLLPVVATLLIAFPAGGAELPVRRVIVYKNGVGYYERAGEVRAGETALLEFKQGEMNDVLKSLVVEDRRGVAVRGIRYELSEDAQRALGELPVPLEPGQALATLLDQWKGARVELRLGAQTVAGLIVGGRVAPAANQSQRQELTLLLDGGEIRVVDLDSVGQVRLLDPRLQDQLRQALSILTRSRSREKRAVTIESVASGTRQLLARYLAPSPVWKSSYRLILPDTGEATLEGWAIVDNASGVDWDNVELTVVSGRPVSFVTNLYEPLFVERVTAALPGIGSAAPVLHEGSVRRDVAATAELALAQEKDEAGFDSLASARKRMMAAAPPSPPKPVMSAISPDASAREVGELFEYRFATPVTARQGQSAMIPFVQQKIAARRLLVYSDRSSQNPRAAVEIANNTGKTLDGGPITVLQGGGYAGEALMDVVKAGDKRLVSYAVDLGTRITTKLDTGARVVRSLRASRGMMTRRTAVEQTTTYTINNVDTREKTLFIEHAINPSLKLIKPKPEETAPNQYRFSVKLPAAGSQTLAVVEERELEDTISLINLTPDVLLTYLQNVSLSAPARKQLETIGDRKREIATVDAQIRNAERQVEEVNRDSARLRENINTLRGVSGQQDAVQRYAAELAQHDAALAKLREQTNNLRARRTALESELNSLIEKIEF